MGKSNTSTTRNVAEPWSGVKKYYTDAYKDAEGFYKEGAPEYYPGQMTAPLSGYTSGAIDWMADRAQAGSPVVESAQDQLTKTMGGDYLDAGNPYFSKAVDAATRPLRDQYSEQIAPGIDSTFSSAGRYGSDAHATAAQRGGEGLMRAMGDVSSGMAEQNYRGERDNQIRGMLFAPELAQQDYFDINQLGTAGSMLDQQNQRTINDDVNKYNYEQNAPQAHLSSYMGLLGNAPWGSVTTAPKDSPNLFTSALGGAATGYGIGGPVGAAIGGGAGLLSGLFG